MIRIVCFFFWIFLCLIKGKITHCKLSTWTYGFFLGSPRTLQLQKKEIKVSSNCALEIQVVFDGYFFVRQTARKLRHASKSADLSVDSSTRPKE